MEIRWYYMVALTTAQYKSIIGVMKQGFKNGDNEFRGNNRIATVLVIQANLGLRIGDLLELRLNDIINDGDRYRLNIFEDKTDKKRTFTVPKEIYNYIKMYTLENSIKSTSKIFDITVRAVQKQLKLVTQYLELQNISTHSFRKYFATQIYINNNYNVALVRELLQHSDLKTTQKYINIGTETVEKALNNHIQLL